MAPLVWDSVDAGVQVLSRHLGGILCRARAGSICTHGAQPAVFKCCVCAVQAQIRTARSSYLTSRATPRAPHSTSCLPWVRPPACNLCKLQAAIAGFSSARPCMPGREQTATVAGMHAGIIAFAFGDTILPEVQATIGGNAKRNMYMVGMLHSPVLAMPVQLHAACCSMPAVRAVCAGRQRGLCHHHQLLPHCGHCRHARLRKTCAMACASCHLPCHAIMA